MKTLPFLAALLLALPLAVTAQTKPAPAPAKTPAATAKTAPGMQQVTEVTEDLDPETGKVIRRTTRTVLVPAGSAPSAAAATKTTAPTTTSTASDAGDVQATDTQVSDFFREKTAVSKLSTTQLVDAYSRFVEKVREDRRNWNAADWNRAAAVLSSLNARYEQLRSSFSFDDKLSIRSHQAEFQALRTAKQISKDVSDKL